MEKKEGKNSLFLWYLAVFFACVFAVAGIVVGYRLASLDNPFKRKEVETINVYEENGKVKEFVNKTLEGHTLPGYYADNFKGNLLTDENLKLIIASSYIEKENITPNVDYTTGVYYNYTKLTEEYKKLFGQSFEYKTYSNFKTWNEDFTKEDPCDKNNKETCYVTWDNESKTTFTIEVEDINENTITGKITVNQDENDTVKHEEKNFTIELKESKKSFIISQFTIK